VLKEKLEQTVKLVQVEYMENKVALELRVQLAKRVLLATLASKAHQEIQDQLVPKGLNDTLVPLESQVTLGQMEKQVPLDRQGLPDHRVPKERQVKRVNKAQ
jgi:hypothetical protein